MLTVREVTSRRDAKKFIELPLKLYRGCKYFVPPLYADEKKLLKNKGKAEGCEAIFLLAERDGRTVGRIQGIIQGEYNRIHSTREVRFTRFDAIDDAEVAAALFGAVAEWGKARGMTEIVGPLGYSDLDREGLLVYGFDEYATFEEQYNYEYYEKLLLACGFECDATWLEFELTKPERKNEMLRRVAERTLELNGLHVADTNMPKREYIRKYRDGFFECIERCYAELYGTTPISREMQNELIKEFMLILNNRYLVFICDKDDRVVALGLCFPAIGGAISKTGKLGPLTVLRILRAVKKPQTIDLGLVAVMPEYRNAGLNAVILEYLTEMLDSGDILKCETNLNLETNTQVLAQWKHFTSRMHKKRKAYRKTV